VKVNSKKELLFKNLGPEIKVGRYHSWVVEGDLPDCFDITSVDENGLIMAIRHKELDVKGVQFHPESVLTPDGKTILKNWINS
jgi:anthranilate synthase component 2